MSYQPFYSVPKNATVVAVRDTEMHDTVQLNERIKFEAVELLGVKNIHGSSVGAYCFSLTKQWPNTGYVTMEVRAAAVDMLYEVPSNSNPNKKYEVLCDPQGDWSCNCMAWTLRVGKNGERHCKHIDAVKS